MTRCPVCDETWAMCICPRAADAWEALRDAVNGSNSPITRDRAILRHRPIIEAAIRAEGLDVKRVEQAMANVRAGTAAVDYPDWNEAVAAEYAALGGPDATD